MASLLLVGLLALAGSQWPAVAISTDPARPRSSGAGGGPFTFTDKLGSISPAPRIAIVSEKAFHLEVLAGFMEVLKPYADNVVVYLHPMNFQNRAFDFGFKELMEGFGGDVRALPAIFMPRFDYMIFISPEYRVTYVKDLIRQAQPKGVLLMVHNGDGDGVVDLPWVHSNATLVTLSPHVAEFVEKRLNRTIDWMLPLKRFEPKAPCKATDSPACLAGFAIQGTMDMRRRNYTEIWLQLDERINSSAALAKDPRLHINVVGSGNPSKLLVPPQLKARVTPHVNLKFPEFYELIHHNLALVPTVAQDAYYDRKFSSTLITSLVTGVPVIVNERFLQAYSFLEPAYVFLQHEEDSTLDVCMRILDTRAQKLQMAKDGLVALREQLSQRAARLLHQLLTQALQRKAGAAAAADGGVPGQATALLLAAGGGGVQSVAGAVH